MYCPHCGEQIPDDSAFCPKCGEKINRSSQSNEMYDSAYDDSNYTKQSTQNQNYSTGGSGNQGNGGGHHNTPVLITVIIAAAAVLIVFGALLIQKSGNQSVTTSSKAAAASTSEKAEAEKAAATPEVTATPTPTETPTPTPTAAPTQAAPKVIVVKPQATPAPRRDDDDDDLNDYYVFPYSDTYLLTDDDLAGKSAWELTVGRNEICARHGYTFDREDLQEYFDSQSWYYPIGKFDLNTVLSSTELKNMTFIDHYQTAHGLQTS